MSELLLKLFVPNKGADDPEVHVRCGILSGITGIILNALLVAGKLAIGIISGSVAIVADALNNLSDAASSTVTLAGFKLAGKKPDKKHPFGHARMEYIAGLIVSVIVIVMGAELIFSSVEKIIESESAVFSYAAMGVLIAAILIKLWMFYFNRKIAKRIHSPSIKATAADSLSDAFATCVTLAALIGGMYTDFPIDGVAGIIVALFILKTGISSLIEICTPLIGSPAKREIADKIDNLALEHENILGVHDLIYNDYGPGRAVVSFHAEVHADCSLTDAHALADHIEREIREKFGVEAVIHIDPVTADKETPAIKNYIEAKAREIAENITVHDFQTKNSDGKKIVYFDITVPYGLKITDEEIENRLKKALAEYDPPTDAVIHTDHPLIED